MRHSNRGNRGAWAAERGRPEEPSVMALIVESFNETRVEAMDPVAPVFVPRTPEAWSPWFTHWQDAPGGSSEVAE